MAFRSAARRPGSQVLPGLSFRPAGGAVVVFGVNTTSLCCPAVHLAVLSTRNCHPFLDGSVAQIRLSAVSRDQLSRNLAIAISGSKHARRLRWAGAPAPNWLGGTTITGTSSHATPSQNLPAIHALMNGMHLSNTHLSNRLRPIIPHHPCRVAGARGSQAATGGTGWRPLVA